MNRNRVLCLVVLLANVAGVVHAQADVPADYDRLNTYFDHAAGTTVGGTPVVVPVSSTPSARTQIGDEAGEMASPPPKLTIPVPGKPAAAPLIDIDGSDWKQVGSVGDSTGDNNPSAREKQDFWEKLRDRSFWNSTFDQICKDAEIPLDFTLEAGEIMKVKPEYRRSLKQAPEGGMLIIDKARLNISASKGMPLDLDKSPVPLGISGGISIDGQSYVVRRLPDVKACKALLSLADLRKIKTVYPLKAHRFTEMSDGEIWQLPLVLTAGISPGGSVPLDPNGVINFNISFGYSRSGDANVSLRRLDREHLRVRIRIDYARITGPNIGLVATVPGTEFDRFKDKQTEFMTGILGEVGKVASNAALHQFKRWLEEYFTARISWMAQWTHQDHALIEFVLDPNDAEQMKGLEELLAGGHFNVLDTLTKRLRIAAEAMAHQRSLGKMIVDWRTKYKDALEKLAGGKSFTGTDEVWTEGNGFGFKLPILWDHSHNHEKRHDFISIMDDSGGRFDSFKSKKDSSNGLLHLPFVGDYHKYNESRSVMAFSYAEKEGLVVSPTVVFIHQEGFINKGEGDARQLVLAADGVMGLAGTRGKGRNPKTGVPLQNVFPTQNDADYRRGLGAFTLVLGEEAVQEIVSAPAADVIRAVINSLPEGNEKKVLGWCFDNSTVDERGRLVLADAEKAPDWPYNKWDRHENNLADGFKSGVRSKAKFAVLLARQLRDVSQVRPPDSKDPVLARKQAEALKGIIAGSVSHNFTYEDMMRILVQLGNPDHMTAELVIQVNAKSKGAKDVAGRYLFNRGIAESPVLQRLYEIAAKFNPPSTFSD